MNIAVRQYLPTDFESAVEVLGDAFVTDPLHVAAFGSQRLDQNRLFFRIGLEHLFTSHAYVVLAGDELQGYVHLSGELQTGHSDFQSFRGTVLAASALPQRWRSALLGAAEPPCVR